jgi:hypothetical protein
MQQIQRGDQTVNFDREKTIRAYSAMQTGDAERCGCLYCRNFAAQRKSAYPDHFRSLLDHLGIDPEKEGEAYECGPEDGLHHYGGWFYCSGEIVTMGERLVKDVSGFQYWFADGKQLPRPPVDFGEKVIAVEFTTKLPWIIPQQP